MRVPLKTVSIQQTSLGFSSSSPGPSAEMGTNTLLSDSSESWAGVGVGLSYQLIMTGKVGIRGEMCHVLWALGSASL